MPYLLLLAGLAALLAGAELLVQAASRLARAFGIPKLAVGLTVVAYGTSAPELVISATAAASGQPNIALGNVVGSNVANILCILGVSALIVPLTASARVIRWDVPAMIGASLIFFAMAWDGGIGAADGSVLVVLLACFTWWNLRQVERDDTTAQPGLDAGWRSRGRQLLVIAIGLVCLSLGSRWFVSGAVTLARDWALSELVIGLTIVAGGTSLPELATSVVAAFRGERDIAVGNVIGSNIFNLLGVMGISALMTQSGIAVPSTAIRFDIPIMIVAAVACLPIFFTGSRISRGEGALFLAYYVAYVVFIVMSSRKYTFMPVFTQAMLYFAIPLTAITLGILVGHAILTTRNDVSS